MANETIEWAHTRQFLKLISADITEFTKQPQNEPDFIFNFNGKTIGLEHTQLIRLPDERKVNIKGHSMNGNKIIANAEKLFYKTHDTCLLVAIDFRCTYGLVVDPPIQLEKKDIRVLSEFISNFVQEKLPYVLKLKHGESLVFEAFDFDNGKVIFPPKIELIRIQNTSKFKDACWTQYEGIAVPNIYQSLEFKTRISEKNKKPANYQNAYDQLWLLLVEDSMDLTSYFDFDDQLPTAIETSFYRIFVLRRSLNEYIEIPTVFD